MPLGDEGMFGSFCNSSQMYCKMVRRILFCVKRRKNVYWLLLVFILIILMILHKYSVFQNSAKVKEYLYNEIPSLKKEGWILAPCLNNSHSVKTLQVNERVIWNIYPWTSSNCSQEDSLADSSVKDAVQKIVQLGGKFIFFTKQKSMESLSKILPRLTISTFSWTLKSNGGLDLSSYFLTSSTLSSHQQPHIFSFELQQSPTIQKVLTTNDELQGMEPQTIVETSQFYFRAPPVRLPYIVPFQQDSMLFHYDAFWAIYPTFRKNGLWSVWLQRLLHEIRGNGEWVSVVAGDFLSSRDNLNNVDPSDNFRFITSDHFNDLDPSTDIKSVSRQSLTSFDPSVVQKLDKWTCTCSDKDKTACCALSLTHFMLDLNLIAESEFQDLVRWVLSLTLTGYKFPKSEVVQPHASSHRIAYGPAVSLQSLDSRQAMLDQLCNHEVGNCSEVKDLYPHKSNLLLVIVFNTAGHYDVLKYLELLYRPVFKHIVYCGTNMDEFLESAKSLPYPVSFIEMIAEQFVSGELGYNCIQNAIRMNYDVDGYIHLSDDVLLNVWNLASLPRDKLWFPDRVKGAKISDKTVMDIWRDASHWPWNSKRGRKPLSETFATLRSFRNQSGGIVKKFLKQLEQNSGHKEGVYYQASDIFYVPRKFAQAFDYLMNFFDYHGVYLEIAIPTVIHGLDDIDNIHRLNGDYLWYSDRQYTGHMFNAQNIFLHPVKLGTCLGKTECKNLICKSYLPCLQALLNKV